jgi:ferredoxin-NADP reductase
VRRLGMIAGGTGLTPMLQIVKRVLKRKDDTTQLSLVFANQTEPVCTDHAFHYYFPSFIAAVALVLFPPSLLLLFVME